MPDADTPLDRLSIAPDGTPISDSKRQADAGSDESIQRRLQRDPANPQARLDNALDESMDASDPPSSTQPGKTSDAAPSSGFDAEAERKLRDA